VKFIIDEAQCQIPPDATRSSSYDEFWCTVRRSLLLDLLLLFDVDLLRDRLSYFWLLRRSYSL
jgi:hypothetical protein